ncbi:hypothetical protein ACN4EK_12210 [Pantanalinema rosaneae CENA516]|uniref:hypothetical protein n=1 Tax=Pantanalinema rosaneae TaxID=1620701 RepID=UPI003D6F9E37
MLEGDNQLMEGLADIEALSMSCCSEYSKEYISEAILCYRAGAYRAAIVSTWIAVVFDLIDKIRELSLSGDANAKQLEQQYEKYLQQIEEGNDQGVKLALEFERGILVVCKEKLQFFDQQQFIDLCRLREDRHRCAHPSFQKVGQIYQSSAEQARLHLRNAITHVLSQPPVQGKAALTELVSLVSSTYFPTETSKALTQLKNSPLQKPTEALVNGFVDRMLLGFVDINSPLHRRTQVIAAINAILQMYPREGEIRLTKQLNKLTFFSDVQFLDVVILVASIVSAWSFLNKSSQEKVAEFIRIGFTYDVIKVLHLLSKLKPLEQPIKARIAMLSFEELAQAISSYNLGAPAKERALQFLSMVSSWNRANEVFDKVILPIFDELEKSDIMQIIRFPKETEADLIGATGFSIFIERVRLSKLFDDDELNQLLSQNGASYLVLRAE